MRVYLLVIDTIKLHIIKFHFLIWQSYIYFYIRYTYFISLSSKNSAYIVSYITLRKSVELIYNYVAEKIQLHYSSQANPKGTCEKKNGTSSGNCSATEPYCPPGYRCLDGFCCRVNGKIFLNWIAKYIHVWICLADYLKSYAFFSFLADKIDFSKS